MAMAASYFEAGKNAEEKKSLQWLEEQEPPKICYNPNMISERTRIDAFVPVNDKIKAGVSKGSLITTLEMPIKRLRKQRPFHTTVTGFDPVVFLWDVDADKHVATLDSICSRIHRLGHSSSFVMLRVTNYSDAEPELVPFDLGSYGIRWAIGGMLAKLEQAYKHDVQIKKPNSIDTYFIRKARLNSISLPEIRYGKPYQNYTSSPRGQFSDMIVLRLVKGPYPKITDTLDMVSELRQRLDVANASEYVSGLDGGKPTKNPHIAIVPLAFTGSRYSDGLVRGLAIVLPLTRSINDEQYISKKLFGAENSGHRELNFSLDSRDIATLKQDTWIQPSKLWGTVTPIVLDRVPHVKDKTEWYAQIEKTIAKSCRYQGLPEPYVSSSDTSFIRGVPSANRFPKLMKRLHVHALLEFESKVLGPVIIGAGRYKGYGFCRPLPERWFRS